MRCTTLLLASLLLVAASGAAHSAGLAVPLDEARMITFAKPVATLYVGNPVIADVTVIDKRHAFVLGKSFGTTNIIALDADGTEIDSRRVTVVGSSAATVILHRGAAQVTYACVAQRCEATPVPGDGKDAFDAGIEQIRKHQDLVTKTAMGQAQ
jgi:Flp pilus assembly secretin CpaC